MMSSLKAFKLQFLRPAEHLTSRVQLKRNADQTLPGSYFGIKVVVLSLLMSSFEGSVTSVSRHFGAAIFICSTILQSFAALSV